jgi:spore maturation protein CgeB
MPGTPREGDLVWIGNWGDGERTAELEEFLIQPVRRLGISARVHGVRYPAAAREALAEAGIAYGGWIPNHRVPPTFAAHGVTVHVPRRPYTQALQGIPTIRPFEALACGIPLVSAPWDDVEGLFSPGEDFLVARDGREMERLLEEVLRDAELAASLRDHGLRTILQRHTCAHRVDELMTICADVGMDVGEPCHA